MLKGKNVLLAVTGSIAAYKSTYLVRELIKKGSNVKVIQTESSLQFVTPITLSTLSKNPVTKDFIKNEDTGEWNNHVALGEWADMMLIAPATAHTISNLVTGKADSFFLATFLSCSAPVFVAPAMDLDMFKNESTQANLETLTKRGIHIIDPDEGELASGLEGKGRMKEPEDIVVYLNDYLLSKATLRGKKILVSAGPTYEFIDPVRFIGNHSSGKMGFAIAEEAASRGASVTLITGPVHLTTPEQVYRKDVVSAEEMKNAILHYFDDSDVLIMAAAVADYKPKVVSDEKIKKKNAKLSLELVKTDDILKEIVKNKKQQFVVGFALETNNEQENAKQKLVHKNLDAIVLNSLNDTGAGFGHDTNKVTIITANEEKTYTLKSKKEVAVDILNFIEGC
ncbi:MAG: bifunctional phosphopantothenoylcysteine decarboxylase/phosphopantothenate--cysteine ligase CoaBC [Bacteroidota bacterium]|nr:bifunctional phosphopantothenoylcysteine decarboxylase/phosphopantothenate--cysteine ligase CoaBC [Bacteroidota bacterium]MEC9231862.1 bifunctional phosphopantothenoylcysteine decarboxylase/phosphopantothenate--cysteine ligase CoaBC [Bacteroidota bacterium]